MSGSHLCDICGVFKGRSNSKLRCHKKGVHSVGENSVYDCLFCGKHLTMFSKLDQHLRCHTKERPSFCKLCNAEFSNNDNLSRHLDLHDPKRKPKFYCKICVIGLADISSFLRHHRLLHSTNVKEHFKCEQSPKVFSLKENLGRHMTEHSKEKPFACGICEKAFSQKSTLERHIQSHLNWERRFSCQLCSKRFKFKQNLKRHIDRLHMKEGFKFSCKKCDKKFYEKSDLTRHEFAHNEIPHQKYCCRFCRKSLASKSNLTTHLRVHTREKPYHCEICGARFTSLSSVKVHSKRRHNHENLE